MAIHTNELNGLALCAGFGGLEIGLHIAQPNYRTVCFVEREAYAAATLVARMEDQALDSAPIWSDVKTFDGRQWRGKVSIITGGYPCQPFSFSGLRKGKDDPRHIWPDIKRIVREIEPEWCFFENVEGHVNMGSAQVIKDLRSMGYTVKAGLFSALETGASHLRRRFFILAHADNKPLCMSCAGGNIEQGNEVPQRSDASRQSIRDRPSGKSVDQNVDADEGLWSETYPHDDVGPFSPAPFEFAVWAEALERHPELQPELFGLDNGVANWVDRSRGAGNGVVSMVAAYAFRTLKAAHFVE